MDPMANRVKVWKYVKGLTIETNNFAFGVKVILGLQSTYLESWETRTDEQTNGRTEKARLDVGAPPKKWD